MLKMTYHELCDSIITRLNNTTTLDNVRYLSGYYQGYRDCLGKDILESNEVKFHQQVQTAISKARERILKGCNYGK